jgi:hypothetical protein
VSSDSLEILSSLFFRPCWRIYQAFVEDYTEEELAQKRVLIRSFVALYYRLKNWPFLREFLEIVHNFGIDGVPDIPSNPDLSLFPFNLEQLRQLSKFGATSHHLIFEKQQS